MVNYDFLFSVQVQQLIEIKSSGEVFRKMLPSFALIQNKQMSKISLI